MIRSALTLCCLTVLFLGCRSPRPVFSEGAVARAIVEPSVWGGTPPGQEARRHAIRRLTLHHGGEAFPAGRDVPAHLRNLQAWSRREKGWVDIPYHFVIDLEGRVYRCRPLALAGDTNTDYDPTGHALVCVLGNYEEVQPSERQLQALEDVFAMLCLQHGLGPEVIATHRDFTSGTVCPGRHLTAHVGRIREGVRRRLEASRRADVSIL